MQVCHLHDGSARPKRRNGSTKSSSRLEKILESLGPTWDQMLGEPKKKHICLGTWNYLPLIDLIGLDLHVRCLEKSKKYSPKWLFDADLPWYKVHNHLKHIQVGDIPLIGEIMAKCGSKH